MSKGDISINPDGHTWESRRKIRTFRNTIEWMTCTNNKQREIREVYVFTSITQQKVVKIRTIF